MNAYVNGGAPSSEVSYPASSPGISPPTTSSTASFNWSGYNAGTYEPNTPTYVAIDGESVAPVLGNDSSCYTNGVLTGVSIWVGLGGTNTQSPGLVQQGIVDCGFGNPAWYPFTQFPEQQAASNYFCGYSTWTIPQGDVVLDEMSFVQSSDLAYFYLENVTTGVGHGCSDSPPSGWSFDGSTAEWITEQIWSSGTSEGLAKYNSFSFHDDYAELDSNGDFVSLGSQSNNEYYTGCPTSITQEPGAINSDQTDFSQYWEAYRYSC